MTPKLYTVVINPNGAFDQEFLPYAKGFPDSASRLALTLLKAFARDRNGIGEHLRGAANSAVFVVPPRHCIEKDGLAGALVLVDDKTRSIEPLKFLHPHQTHNWDAYIRWAETLLKI